MPPVVSEATIPAFDRRDWWLAQAVGQESDPTPLVERLIALWRDSGKPMQRIAVTSRCCLLRSSA